MYAAEVPVLAGTVRADNSVSSTVEKAEFARGYYLFFGAVAGFLFTAALGMTVIIGYSAIRSDSGPPSGAAPLETTVAGDEPGEEAGDEAGDPIAGQQIYAAPCAACHGPNAEGLPGLGPSLIGNSFVASLSDDELVAFLNEGRPADHPDNTTGIAMPPKGGNASLTEEDLDDVAAYLRTLQ